MREQKMLYGGISLLIGLVIGMFAGTRLWNYTKVETNPTQNQTKPVDNSLLDQHFIEQMIPHHQDAITMSNLALDKARKTEIKTLAQAIIQVQQKEIDQMRTWYKSWYFREIPVGEEVMSHHGMMGVSGMHMGLMGNDSDITRLQNAADFDKAFIEHMIPHHQMAVMMANMLKDGTAKPQIKQLAEDIIFSQSEEINKMRKWYGEWYK